MIEQKQKVKLSDELTKIIEMITKGNSNSEIAKELNYSRRNVVYKINKLFKLYGVQNRTQLANEYILEKLGNF